MEPILIPNVSVGNLKFGNDIDQYLNIDHVYYSKSEEYLEDLYVFASPPLNVYVNNKNKISVISCSKACYYKKINLIGLRYYDFISSFNLQPDNGEVIYLLVNGKGQNQKVYDFDALGVQLWTWRGKIVTVSCIR